MIDILEILREYNFHKLGIRLVKIVANEFFGHFTRTNFREGDNFKDFARTNFREGGHFKYFFI